MTAVQRASARPDQVREDDLERYVEVTSAADPAFRAALQDAEDLQRVLDSLFSLRRTLKLNQAEVARRMGVRQPTISGFENESSDPKLSTLQRYARAVEARLRFVLEKPAACDWVSTSTMTYTPVQATAKPVSGVTVGRGLAEAWNSTGGSRSNWTRTA